MKKSTVCKCVLFVLLGYFIFEYIFRKESLKKEQKQTMKVTNLLGIANQIIIGNSMGQPIHKKLEEKNISSVAIYGMAEIGERVMEDILLNSSVKLLYGIDKRATEIKIVIPVYTLEEACEIEKPEMVILTTFTENDNLKREIKKKMSCEVITIGELLDE